jgi:hypothetical protein
MLHLLPFIAEIEPILFDMPADVKNICTTFSVDLDGNYVYRLGHAKKTHNDGLPALRTADLH